MVAQFTWVITRCDSDAKSGFLRLCTPAITASAPLAHCSGTQSAYAGRPDTERLRLDPLVDKPP